MVDNHPAKIAKYLLKGWSLLNEYCPNGQNIPLVRSKREGALVCAGCTSACPYFATHGEPAAEPAAASTSSGAFPPTPAVASNSVAMTPSASAAAHPAASPPTSGLPSGGSVHGSHQSFEARSPPLMQAAEPRTGSAERRSVPGAAGSSSFSRSHPSSGLPPSGNGTSSTAGVGGTAWQAEAEGGATVTISSPPLRFSCVRLLQCGGGSRGFSSGSGRTRLLGDSLELKVRLSMPSGGGLPEEELREVVRIQRDRLDEKVFLSADKAAGPNKHGGAGQYTVPCEDGSCYTFPERDCLLLPAPRVTLEAIATTVWDSIVASSIAESFHFVGASWLEVSLSESSGSDTLVRRPLRPPKGVGARGHGGNGCLSAVANDW